MPCSFLISNTIFPIQKLKLKKNQNQIHCGRISTTSGTLKAPELEEGRNFSTGNLSFLAVNSHICHPGKCCWAWETSGTCCFPASVSIAQELLTPSLGLTRCSAVITQTGICIWHLGKVRVRKSVCIPMHVEGQEKKCLREEASLARQSLQCPSQTWLSNGFQTLLP